MNENNINENKINEDRVNEDRIYENQKEILKNSNIEENIKIPLNENHSKTLHDNSKKNNENKIIIKKNNDN